MIVCCPQRIDVPPAQFAGIGETSSSPAEGSAAKPLDEKIGHQARVPPVSVGKGVDSQQPVMNAHGNYS